MPPAAKPAPIDRSLWPRPWAQLKFFSFQPAIFPRMLGQVSPDARPGDFVNVFDKNGNLAGGGLFNPRAKIPLRVVCHSTEPVNESYFETAIRRAVELRRTLLLPTDDLLAIVTEFINPAVSRSGLGRCLRRHGVSDLKALGCAEQFKILSGRHFYVQIAGYFLPSAPPEWIFLSTCSPHLGDFLRPGAFPPPCTCALARSSNSERLAMSKLARPNRVINCAW